MTDSQSPSSSIDQFNVSAFFDDHLSLSSSFHFEELKSEEYKLENVSMAKPDGNNMFSIVHNGLETMPIFYIDGELTCPNITAETVFLNRRSNYETKIDKYLGRVHLSPDAFQMFQKNSKKVVEVYKKEKSALAQIAVCGRQIKTTEEFKGIDIVFHGIGNGTEILFTRNVASPNSLPPSSILSPLLPSHSQRVSMIKPRHFCFRPMIPVFNTDQELIIGKPNIDPQAWVDNSVRVYFQIGQSFYQECVHLVPEMVAIQFMKCISESPRKRARTSCLF